MFRPINPDRENARDAVATIPFTFDGQLMMAVEGDTVASALLRANLTAFRTHPVTGEPRGAYCMMGICFECLVEIDGVANRQACQVRIERDMRIRRQRGARA